MQTCKSSRYYSWTCLLHGKMICISQAHCCLAEGSSILTWQHSQHLTGPLLSGRGQQKLDSCRNAVCRASTWSKVKDRAICNHPKQHMCGSEVIQSSAEHPAPGEAHSHHVSAVVDLLNVQGENRMSQAEPLRILDWHAGHVHGITRHFCKSMISSACPYTHTQPIALRASQEESGGR